MELYIIRHGQSLGNLPCTNGQTDAERDDPKLSEDGEKQAALLGERFHGEALDTLISSPLLRAVATAHAVAVRQPSNGARHVELLHDLFEVGTRSDYPGICFSELSRIYPCAIEQTVFPSPAGGGKCLGCDETDSDTMCRASRIVAYIRRRFPGDEKVMLVAHGTLNQCLINAALGYSEKQSFIFCQANTGVTKIRYFDDGRVRLTMMDDLSHLYNDFP